MIEIGFDPGFTILLVPIHRIPTHLSVSIAIQGRHSGNIKYWRIGHVAVS